MTPILTVRLAIFDDLGFPNSFHAQVSMFCCVVYRQFYFVFGSDVTKILIPF